MSKLRPLGKILLDLEPLIQEAMDDHELQHQDLLGLIDTYLKVHYPGSDAEYTDGTNPDIIYRSKRDKYGKR